MGVPRWYGLSDTESAVLLVLAAFTAGTVQLIKRGQVSMRTAIPVNILLSGTLAFVSLYRGTSGFDVHLRPQLEHTTPWEPLPRKDLLQKIEKWYQQYGTDLLKAREFAREWIVKGTPQSDDVELAISYMRIRAARPSVVWECAPAEGYSSIFILAALEHNGYGQLHSFGLETTRRVHSLMRLCCTSLMTRWKYHQGDALSYWNTYDHTVEERRRGNHSSFGTISPPEYVYIDADHSKWFGGVVGEKLLRKLRSGTHVSIHDAYRDGWSSSSRAEKLHLRSHPRKPMPELEAAFAALQLPPALRLVRGFTPSSSFDPQLAADLMAIHDKYMHDEKLVADSNLNPTVYFELEHN